jgi:hypothetical protein
MRRTLKTEAGEKLVGANEKTRRAYARLMQPDREPDPAPPGLGVGATPAEWIRAKKERRAANLFGSMRQEGEK